MEKNIKQVNNMSGANYLTNNKGIANIKNLDNALTRPIPTVNSAGGTGINPMGMLKGAVNNLYSGVPIYNTMSAKTLADIAGSTITGTKLVSGLFKNKDKANQVATNAGITVGQGAENIYPQQPQKVPVVTSSGARKITKENQSLVNNATNQIIQGETQQMQQQPTQQGGGLSTTGTAKMSDTTATTMTSSNYGNDQTLDAGDRQYLATLDQMSARMDASSRALVSSIKSTYSQRESQMADIYNRQQKGMETAGIRSGSAQNTPVLFDQAISQLEKAEQQKLVELDQKEILALSEANQSMQDKNWKMLNEKAKYIKEVRAAKQKALENQLKLAWDKKKFAQQMEYKAYIDSQKLANERARINISADNLVLSREKFTKGSTGAGASTSASASATTSKFLDKNKNPKTGFWTQYQVKHSQSDNGYLDEKGKISQVGMQGIINDMMASGMNQGQMEKALKDAGKLGLLNSKAGDFKFYTNTDGSQLFDKDTYKSFIESK